MTLKINPQVLVAVRRAMRASMIARQKAALARIVREIRIAASLQLPGRTFDLGEGHPADKAFEVG